MILNTFPHLFKYAYHIYSSFCSLRNSLLKLTHHQDNGLIFHFANFDLKKVRFIAAYCMEVGLWRKRHGTLVGCQGNCRLEVTAKLK